MRQRQELVETAELVHDIERRGVNGVAAEVAQKVFVFLDHGDGDAGTGQQKPEPQEGSAEVTEEKDVSD